MSYVITEPELVQGAAQDLAGIRESLVEATANVSGPTTAIAAAGQDEISIAIATMFGNFGQEFQVLNAQAQAFHTEFESLLASGASAYVGAEAANAEQLLTDAVHGAALPGAGANLLMRDFDSFSAAVAAPYQTLFSNTANNLQAVGSTVSAHPFPFLHQFMSNQQGYARTFGMGVATAFQNFPATLANIPETLQLAAQGVSTFNPGVLLQHLITNQTGDAQTIVTALQNSAQDFGTGVSALPASFQAAGHALLAGNVHGAFDDAGQGLLKTVFTGLNGTVESDGVTILITPGGALGQLLPIFSIPGHMAQNFTNLISAGSIPAQVSQHFANLVSAVTDTSITSTISLAVSPNFTFFADLNTHMGLPLVLAVEALGGPINGLSALGSSATAFANAIQTGNAPAAAAAVLDAPAVFANGFLNGQVTIPLSVDAIGIQTTLNLPLDGILAPPAYYSASTSIGVPGVVTGTPISGIIPGLLNYLPEVLAAEIGGPPAFVIPPLSAL